MCKSGIISTIKMMCEDLAEEVEYLYKIIKIYIKGQHYTVLQYETSIARHSNV